MATILRSSKYVRNFVEFATKVGFSHIKGDSRVCLLAHQRSFAPSSFARSLATQVAAKELDNESKLEINLRNLDADVKRYGRISSAKIRRVLDAFEQSKSITSTQAVMMIRCCGNLITDELPESKSELVNRFWKSLENSGIQLDLSHYNALLRVYIENEYPFSPTEVLAELQSKGIEPNKITYERIINRYCQQGDIEGASKILEFMREKEISVNEKIFTALVRGHSEAGDMVSAADILSVMRRAGLEPSADTYKELLCGYAKHGDVQSITKTVVECQSRDVHLLDTDFLDVIFSLASNGHGAHVETILSVTPKEVGYLQDVLRYILKLVHAGQIDIARQVLSSVPSRDRGRTGSSVIKQLVATDLPIAALLDLCNEIESKGINSRARLVALESILLQGNVEQSLAFLQDLKKSDVEIREHYFWPIFLALGRSNNNTGIDNLLSAMRNEYALTISGEMLRDYVVPNKTGQPEQILAELHAVGIPTGSIAHAIMWNMVVQMELKTAADFVKQYTFRYNNVKFRQPLVMALAHTNDVTSFVGILQHIYQNRFNAKTINNDEVTVDDQILEPYIIGVSTFIKNGKSEILSRVLEELWSRGYGLSKNCVQTLHQTLRNELTPELSKILDKFESRGVRSPSSLSSSPSNTMDVENFHLQISKLEASLNAYNSDNEVRITTLKRLLYLYGRTKDLPNLEKTVTALKEQGFQFTDSMCRQLATIYLRLDMLDKFEEYLTILRGSSSEYTLSAFQLTQYITLLAKNNRIDDAVQFLQDPKNFELSPDNNTKYFLWKLIQNLVDLGLPEAVNSIFDVLLKNEYIELSSNNLAPLIKVHIVRNDLAEALNVFEKICETYQFTPAKNELSKKLIEAEDATALQRLTDLSTQVHGESNSLHELALSFIECDCLRQAKKILQIPALHSKFRRLVSGSNRYRELGRTNYLERIVSVIQDIPHFKVMSEFYDDLLFCYAKENNWQKGLDLKKQMEEGEIEPSDVFLVTLANLLTRNNQPVPFTLSESQRSINSSEIQRLSKPARSSSVNQQSPLETEDGRKDGSLDTDPTAHKKKTQREKDSLLIESLIQNNKLHTAFEIAESMVVKNVYPTYRVFRYLISEAGKNGEIELLEKFGKHLSVESKRSMNFDNNLCFAYAAAGKTGEYLDKLKKRLEVDNESDCDKLYDTFPVIGVESMCQNNPEFKEGYANLAKDCAARGNMLPMNVLWQHHFIRNQEEEADKIWSEYLIETPSVRFKRIVYHASKNSNPELLRRLIKTLNTSSLVDDNSKGYVYAKLIKLHYMSSNYQESVDVLREALKVISVDNLPKGTLQNMKAYLAQKGLSLPNNIYLESRAAQATSQLT